MTRLEKVLWQDIIKLLSFKTTELFINELAIDNIYDNDILDIARISIDPRTLPYSNEDTFDIWNTYIEKTLPKNFLDKIEDSIDEDRACDIEDYYFYMHERFMFANIFNFWWVIFEDYVSKFPDNIIINNELTQIIKSYINYCENINKSIDDCEILDDWDLYINSLYLPDADNENDINFNYVKELINKFSFIDISYDFWLKLNDFDDEILNDLKKWAIENLSDEAEPVIPMINYSEEETDE